MPRIQPTPGADQTAAFERALKQAAKAHYRLRLYVTGATPRSLRAIENLKRICEEHLQGRYSLEVVDVYQQPVLAKGDQIIAAPTLIKHLPLPLRRFIGDMANAERILLGLDLKPATEKASAPAPRKRRETEFRKKGEGSELPQNKEPGPRKD